MAPAIRDYPLFITVPASPTVDQDKPDETLYSRASPFVQATENIEQPTNLASTDPLQRYTRLTDLYLGSQHVQDLQINYKDTQG